MIDDFPLFSIRKLMHTCSITNYVPVPALMLCQQEAFIKNWLHFKKIGRKSYAGDGVEILPCAGMDAVYHVVRGTAKMEWLIGFQFDGCPFRNASRCIIMHL